MGKLNLPTKASAVFLLWAATAIALPAQTFTDLYNFNGTSGISPLAGLVQGADGNFYGTTAAGGARDAGTVFEITLSGTLTMLHSFDWTSGAKPYAGLIQAADGNFYGTTNQGGAGGCYYKVPNAGCGTIFQITPSGTLTTLYNLCSQANCTDGANPYAGLVQGTDGNFYGTTVAGGTDDDGTVFKITPSGVLTTLHSFTGQPDGYEPSSGLVQGADGNFYGTTVLGGINANSAGTVFEITPGGTLTTIYNFLGVEEGYYPFAGLVLASDGNFYGITQVGGANNYGTVFKITPSGVLTTVYNFCSQHVCMEGSFPQAGLIQGTNGEFYGTMSDGGANEDGTVFSLSVGPGPFVKTNPAAGKVGATVGILGTDLTGATGVKFNGTETAFRLVSKTFIEAKVPSGATSGKVTVRLSSGTLSSNVPFIVLR